MNPKCAPCAWSTISTAPYLCTISDIAEISLTIPSYVGDVIITAFISLFLLCSVLPSTAFPHSILLDVFPCPTLPLNASSTSSGLTAPYIPASGHFISGKMYSGFSCPRYKALITERCTFLATSTLSPLCVAPHMAAITPAVLPFTRRQVSSAPKILAASMAHSFIIPVAL